MPHTPVKHESGLELALAHESDIKVVGQVSTGDEILTQVEQQHPDVVLVSVQMPRISGVELVREIRDRHPEVRSILLMAAEDEPRLIDAVRSGALGYVSSSDDPETLVDAVRQVAIGKLVIDPELATALAAELLDRQWGQLDAEETEVLQLLRAGSNREIAAQLGISSTTVYEHLRQIIEKIAATR